jgi:polyphosphate kinase
MIRSIRDDVLEAYLADNVKARVMLPNGAYTRRKAADGRKRMDAQEHLLQRRRAAARGKKNNRKPHQHEAPAERT